MKDRSTGTKPFYHSRHTPDPHAANLTAKEFSWLLPEAWNPEQARYYEDQKNTEKSALALLPAYVRRARRPCPQHVAAWVLSDPEKSPLGWADMQLLEGPIPTTHIFLGGLQNPHACSAKALAFILSSSFLANGTEVAKVFSLSPGWQQLLASSGLGEARDIIVPSRQFGLNGLLPNFALRSISYTIYALDWKDHPLGKLHSPSLQYLALRAKRLERCPSLCRDKTFWQRVFRFWD